MWGHASCGREPRAGCLRTRARIQASRHVGHPGTAALGRSLAHARLGPALLPAAAQGRRVAAVGECLAAGQAAAEGGVAVLWRGEGRCKARRGLSKAAEPGGRQGPADPQQRLRAGIPRPRTRIPAPQHPRSPTLFSTVPAAASQQLSAPPVASKPGAPPHVLESARRHPEQLHGEGGGGRMRVRSLCAATAGGPPTGWHALPSWEAAAALSSPRRGAAPVGDHCNPLLASGVTTLG